MTNGDKDQQYFMSHILPVYKRAVVWDDNLCWIGQSWTGSFYSYNATKRVKEYVVGSCADGACSPRLYRTSPILEADRLLLWDGTGTQYGHPHPDKVGVFMDPNWSQQKVWDFIAKYDPDLVESPSPDSHKNLQDAHYKAQKAINSNPLYYPKWYDSDRRRDISNCNKGPSMKESFFIHDTHVHFQVDRVIASHHQGWPQDAKEWTNRARLWPPQSVVEQVLQQGYQVVTKYSSSTGIVDGPIEQHITFALCERYLARQRTPVQRFVYLMAKTLFYTYLELHDDDNPNIEFPSYALKTSMMWLMEQTPVDRWTEENVLFLLRELLIHLKDCTVTGTMKNYFMIGANVLSNCTPNLLVKAEKQISQILFDMNKCLQGTELFKCNVLFYGYYISTQNINAYNKVVYKCQNQVLAKGLLQAMKIKHKMRATYKRIIEILERGTGDGLKAKGYLFDEEECFHILKTMLNLYSTYYIKFKGGSTKLHYDVIKTLHRYPVSFYELIERVLCLDQHLPKPEVTIVRLLVQWQDRISLGTHFTAFGDRVEEVKDHLQHNYEWNYKIHQGIRRMPGETDMIVVREGQDISVHKWSAIGDLIERCVRDLQDNEAGWWMSQIYSLTHRDIPEVQLMDFARMLYLLYVCDDKRAPD